MLENLTQRLSTVVKNIKGEARFTENNIADILREVRLALLEADVALPIVKSLVAELKEQALGSTVQDSLTPSQAFVSLVRNHLIEVIGGQIQPLNLANQPPVIILMAGLQGVGKTTTTAKLGKLITEKHKKKVMAVSCDVYRPAARKQLATVSEQAKITCFEPASDDPIDIAKQAARYAKQHLFDVLLIDTAGRLAIDDEMMTEISTIHQTVKPAETLFVTDAMLGQDAVKTAKAFKEALTLTGVVLTKLDGDARGGAALSVNKVTGCPVKFSGVGEKLDALEVFDPKRLADRILGMGDIVGIIEQVSKKTDAKQAEKMAKDLLKGKAFTLEDYRAQLGQISSAGGIDSLLSKLPAQFSAMASQAAQSDAHAKSLKASAAAIDSMTIQERRNPEIIKANRKKRIAAGAGITVQEVNQLLSQFNQMCQMFKQFGGKGSKAMRRMLGQFGGLLK